MGLFKITAKKSGNFGAGRIMEEGMNIEIISHNNPIGTTKGRELVRQQILNKYGVDLKNFISQTYFEVEKIN